MLKPELNIPINIFICKKKNNHKNPIIGIYKITSPKDKIYIGQATDIENRFSDYRLLTCGKQKKIYNSLKKYGIENHIFEIIHLCTTDELNDWEVFYIKYFDTFDTLHGLNLKEGGYGGGRWSNESKKRLSESQKNKLFLPYEECKKWVNENKLTKYLKSKKEWNKITKQLPLFIPKDPEGYYKRQDTWELWSLFLINGNKKGVSKKGVFLTYEEVKKWVQENELTKNIKSEKEWKKITKLLPSFIPKNPQQYYAKLGTWNGYSDFLNNGKKSRFNIVFLSYEEAKKWLKGNWLTKNIKTQKEWLKITHILPSFIPKNPYTVYKDKGWKGLGDFLGTKNKIGSNGYCQDFLSYNSAEEWVQKNIASKGINTIKKWQKNKNLLPSFIPKNPNEVYYKRGWKGWGNFLGTGNIHKGDFLNYEECKIWVNENELTKNIKSVTKWEKLNKDNFPSFIPKHPRGVYEKSGYWKGWRDFFGTEKLN